MLIVLTTTPNAAEAEALAEKIVDAKLAACVQILPQMQSVYFWEEKNPVAAARGSDGKGEVRKEPEHLLLIKTLEEKFEALSEFVRQNHSYEVPEIVAVGADKISEGYLKWMTDYLT